ncbi:MAG: 3'-5' exonuclease [archaeon]|nr:3'-5' exonuclease [archaeon]
MNDFQSAFNMKRMDVPDTILVLDTETTGLEGARYIDDPTMDRFFKCSRVEQMGGYDALDWKLYGDLVVDIGICEVSLSKGTVKDVYSAIVGYDTDSWTQEMEESWIFENTDLTVDQVRNGVPFSQVRKEVRDVIKGRWLTTYNVQYDLDKFLYRFPWNVKGLFNEVRDIMFSAKDVCKLKSPLYGVKEYRYPKLDYAYKTILKGEDPAGINGVQDHRALSDARVASHLMIKMFNDGQYDPMDFSGRYARD